MRKILIVMDDINYRGGAHYATFNIANFLASYGNSVSIYSQTKATLETKGNLSVEIDLLEEERYVGYDYIIVPFENSIFREKVSKMRKCIKVQWVHNDYEKWKNVVALNIEKEREIYEGFDKVIFVTNHIKESFLKCFPEFADKCGVVYNFIDTEKILELGNKVIDDEIFQKKDTEQLNITVVGRLEPQKAYSRLIDIVKILNEKGFKTEWFILGEGYEYELLKKKCLKYSINNVNFLGFKKNPYPYIKKADLFALLSEYEGFGLVIAESLLLGVPALVTDTGVVKEVLSPQYGWIVENDIYSIIDSIEYIYANRIELEKKRESLTSYIYNNSQIERDIVSIFNINMKNTINHKNSYFPLKQNDLESPLVSIIVPVFNMENYLEECLDSLVNQSLNEIEIIIVNDGSTDRSMDIISDYAYRYADKIRAFSIDNGGLGEARNYGIKKARGKYLGFVDSDDIVRKDMFELLYKDALKNNADCVITDYIAVWEDGKEEYISSVPAKIPDRFEILKYSTKFGIVNACTKLIDKDLFQHATFPKGFYEDLATIPILLSYAKNISYLNQGLYIYRQRPGSITSVKNNDSRLLDCYKAWDRILSLSCTLYKKEIIYAVYWSMNFFCTNFLTDFTIYSKDFYCQHKAVFAENEYIKEDIRKSKLTDFDNLPLIPSIIHYCWFGKNEKSEVINLCINSWKKYAPNFKIIEWNESNCDIHENNYVELAYEQKKWAFVSDYYRLKALYEYGGIYLDTDMELMKSIEPFLYNKAFFAFETPIFVHAGIIGAEAKNPFIKKILDTYENDIFEINENNIPLPIPRRITEIFEKEPDFVKSGKTQTLSNGIKIYSANIMTMNFHDGFCVANHHYEGNWLCDDKKGSQNYGYEVMKHYFTWDLLHELNDNCVNATSAKYSSYLSTNRDYKLLYDQVISSTSWKVMAPLRKVLDLIKRIIRGN